MPDKFPPKNSEFRFESFRFSSDVTDCRHAIYHHGCPSCDERDPEGNEVCAVCGEIYCPGCELAAAEKVMDPILRRWFGYDCAPHEVGHYAENAAVDLSWALQNAGLLASPAASDVIAELCANVDRLRAERDALRAEVQLCRLRGDLRAEALRARLDAAEAERDAALDSPEGVVTLDGKQWRVEGQRWSVTMGEDGVWDGEGMPPGTYVRLVPYQPEDPKHG